MTAALLQKEGTRTNRYCDGSFFVKGASKRWYFMPISVWQWAAPMNDGPSNWCAQHSAWGSWISGLEHTAKLICFVKDGGRGEGRLLSFRQEPSTWCQERRRCSSCCLCCNPHHPITLHHPSPPHRHQSTHQHVRFGVCARAPTNGLLQLNKAGVSLWQLNSVCKPSFRSVKFQF